MRSLVFALVLTLAVPTAALAEMYEVKMLNRGAAGPMTYEPDFLSLQPGDKVKFLNASADHNAVTIEGMVPDGNAGFKGKLNEEIEVTLDQEGFYGIKCSPHFAMGMVMVIRVGGAALPESFVPADVPERARRRFDEILARNGFGK
ncbi:pseudoazurin [Mesorhizobium sp. 2RAF21]|uniref:pseudoazurin n=1 Tax=Mesorhizobium sp. 2RAF21 TaxID=3232995 RepID=UPI003F944D5E